MIDLAVCLVTLAASAVVVTTVVAQLNDQPRRPLSPGVVALARHHGHKLALILQGVGGFMMGAQVLTLQVLPLEGVALVVGLALRQLTHPTNWWAYVARGVPR